MDQPFPFGLPAPTAFYLTVYLLTLMLHIAFMNYVLAGSAYLAIASIIKGKAADESPIYEVLRDWMPFMLSAAITAGIAPLLFLQLLYKEQFYTANLLLFYRWMAILPALILGFYLSYLLKAKRIRSWPLAGRALVGCGAFGCFGFVGWAWVENHLLSLEPSEVWADQYTSASILFRTPELIPRLTLWFVAAFPTMALIVGWQLWYRARRESPPARAANIGVRGSRRVSSIALAGIVLSSVAAGVYFSLLDSAAKDAITGRIALIYTLLSIIGGAIQAAAWTVQLRRGQLASQWLNVASFGLVVNFIGMAAVNESTRLAKFFAAGEFDVLFARHAKAWQVSGLPMFLLFLLINGTLIGLCLRIVRYGRSRAETRRRRGRRSE